MNNQHINQYGVYFCSSVGWLVCHYSIERQESYTSNAPFGSSININIRYKRPLQFSIEVNLISCLFNNRSKMCNGPKKYEQEDERVRDGEREREWERNKICCINFVF